MLLRNALIIVFLCVLWVHLYLPETKDKVKTNFKKRIENLKNALLLL